MPSKSGSPSFEPSSYPSENPSSMPTINVVPLIDSIDDIVVFVDNAPNMPSDNGKIAVSAVDIDGNYPLTYSWTTTCPETTIDEPTTSNPTLRVAAGANPMNCQVDVIVCDLPGGCSTMECNVTIVDPEAGSVTGGGTIQSPAGAYAEDLTGGTRKRAGKASFSIDSKYGKKPKPEGIFKFNVGTGLAFESNSYQWLVISGNCAKIKGSGLVQGKENEFDFILTLCDNGQGKKSSTRDTFRLKIWKESEVNEKESEVQVLYDNLLSSNNEWDGLPITGGNVKLHFPDRRGARNNPRRRN